MANPSVSNSTAWLWVNHFAYHSVLVARSVRTHCHMLPLATSPDPGETALQLLIDARANLTHPYPHFRTRQTRNPNGFA
jgi:hypothetical protein